MNRRQMLTGERPVKPARSVSLGADYYTNAIVRTHDNREVKFYDDLIKDKQVVINFMYTNCDGACPISTANLVKTQKLLGERVGRDIFMYSISLKPWEDDPAALAGYMEAHGVGPGWTFITGDQFDLDTIRFRLFRWDHPGLDFNLEQHVGMVRVINDPLDRWSMCPTFAKPEMIAKAISWVEQTKPYSVRFQENLAKQVTIDSQERLAFAQ
jgi:protein SCO1/2